MFRFKLAEFFSGPGGMGYGAGLSKIKKNTIILNDFVDYLLTRTN